MLGLVSTPTSNDGYQYVASKKSKVFHKKNCEHVATIKKENLIYYHILEEAQASGRRGRKTFKTGRIISLFLYEKRLRDTPNEIIRLKNYQKRGDIGLKFKNLEMTQKFVFTLTT